MIFNVEKKRKSGLSPEKEPAQPETKLVFGDHWASGMPMPENGSVWADNVVKKVKEINPETIIPDGLAGQWSPNDYLIFRKIWQGMADYEYRGFEEFLRIIPVKNPFKFLERGKTLRVISADVSPDFLGNVPADFPNNEKAEADRYLEEEVAYLVRKSDPFFDRLSVGSKTSEYEEAVRLLESSQRNFTRELREKKAIFSAGMAMPVILSAMAVMARSGLKREVSGKKPAGMTRRQFLKYGLGATGGVAVASSLPWAIPAPDSSRDASLRRENSQKTSDILNQIEELAKPESSGLPMIDVRNAIIGLADICDRTSVRSEKDRCIVLGSMHSKGPLPIRRFNESEKKLTDRLKKTVEDYLNPLIRKALRFYYDNDIYKEYPEDAIANLFINIFATYGILEIPQLADNERDPREINPKQEPDDLMMGGSYDTDRSGGPDSLIITREVSSPDHLLDMPGVRVYYSWREERNEHVVEIIRRLVAEYSAKG